MTNDTFIVPLIDRGSIKEFQFNLDGLIILLDDTQKWRIASKLSVMDDFDDDHGTCVIPKVALYTCQDNFNLPQAIRDCKSYFAESGNVVHVLGGRIHLMNFDDGSVHIGYTSHVVWHPDEGPLDMDNVSHVHVIPSTSTVSEKVEEDDLIVDLRASSGWDKLGKLIKENYEVWNNVKQFIYCMLHYDPKLIFGRLDIERSISAMKCYAKESSKPGLVTELIGFYESLGVQFKYSTKTGWEVDSDD